MYTLDDLRQQNQDIFELCEVLSVLIEHHDIYDNSVFCDLMARFKEKVWIHLVFEDNTIYTELARHSDPEVRKVAGDFHESAKRIKKRFRDYVKHWCKPQIDAREHEILVEESRAVLALIRDRIAYENEQMFPLAERVDVSSG